MRIEELAYKAARLETQIGYADARLEALWVHPDDVTEYVRDDGVQMMLLGYPVRLSADVRRGTVEARVAA